MTVAEAIEAYRMTALTFGAYCLIFFVYIWIRYMHR